MTTNSIIIYDSETYVTFAEDGDYRVIQDGNVLAATADRKDRIVRRRRLPNWCLKALKEGYWIEVSEFVPSGTDRNTFYLTVRGKTVRPKVKVETKIEKQNSCDSVWYSKLDEITYQRELLEYNGFQKPVPYYWGWKKVNETFLKGITIEDYENWKKNNPLPANVEVYYEDFIKDDVEYTFKDTYAVRQDYTVVQPHTKGWYYTYRLDSDYKPFIKKNQEVDCWSRRGIKDDKTVLAYIKKELVKSYESYEDSGKYESDDGMRMTSDRYYFTVYVYDIILSDGSSHQVSFRKYH